MKFSGNAKNIQKKKLKTRKQRRNLSYFNKDQNECAESKNKQ